MVYRELHHGLKLIAAVIQTGVYVDFLYYFFKR